MSNSANYPLRLSQSLKKAAEELAKQDGVSMNQFIATAVAEKVAALSTESFFKEWQARADFKAFDQVLNREGGEAPLPEDVLD
jgi:hypothetical protein